MAAGVRVSPLPVSSILRVGEGGVRSGISLCSLLLCPDCRDCRLPVTMMYDPQHQEKTEVTPDPHGVSGPEQGNRSENWAHMNSYHTFCSALRHSSSGESMWWELIMRTAGIVHTSPQERSSHGKLLKTSDINFHGYLPSRT